MTVPAHEWLELIEREYLSDFVTAGGAAVKFAVGDDHQLAVMASPGWRSMRRRRGYI